MLKPDIILTGKRPCGLVLIPRLTHGKSEDVANGIFTRGVAGGVSVGQDGKCEVTVNELS